MNGITTYGGQAIATEVRTFRGMKTYINEDEPMNLLSQGICRKYRATVTYNDKENIYTVRLSDGKEMEFIGRDDLDGLYLHSSRSPHVHATVKKRMNLYTKKEQRKAIEARLNLPNLGFPTNKDYATVITNGSVININMPKLITAAVYRAKQIFGRGMPSYMGKNTRRVLIYKASMQL